MRPNKEKIKTKKLDRDIVQLSVDLGIKPHIAEEIYNNAMEMDATFDELCSLLKSRWVAVTHMIDEDGISDYSIMSYKTKPKFLEYLSVLTSFALSERQKFSIRLLLHNGEPIPMDDIKAGLKQASRYS
ncbi:MAG: hypothetical protein PVG39_04745 [Desulfobacteraceae bacterium]|jgi:hypothetical protein